MSAAPRDLLAAHVLGLLGDEERAAVQRALAADPGLAAERAEVARHLALYERLPAPPGPPPFLAVERALVSRSRGPRRAIGAAALAAAVLAGLGVLALTRETGRGPAPRPPLVARAGPGIRALGHAGVPRGGDEPVRELWADGTGEVRLGGRVRVVLEAGSRLLLLDGEGVRLADGRAYFDVAPGPFTLETPHGPVVVLGTAFEVDVREGLVVAVEHGRVRAGDQELGAGTRLEHGRVGSSPEPVGGFFRRPLLRLEGPGAATPGATVVVRLVLENPTHLRQTIAGPEAVASGALLELTGPDGKVETRGLDMAQAASGGLAALRPVELAPHERRLTAFPVRLPSGPAGTWRLTALYRPSGEAPLASDPLVLEVR